MSAPGTTHNKETFYDYLLFVGLDEDGAAKILNRIAKLKGKREDLLLFQYYLEGKNWKHLYEVE